MTITRANQIRRAIQAELATEEAETKLWQQHLATRRAAIRTGKPDAVVSIFREATKLWKEAAELERPRIIAHAALFRADADIQALMRKGREYCEAPATDISELRRALDRLEGWHKSSPLSPDVLGRLAKVRDLLGILSLVRMSREIDEGATPEVIAAPARQDVIVLLETEERITPEQARAARRIAEIYQAITAASQAKIGQLNGAAGGSVHEMTAMQALIHQRQYLPWTEELRRRSIAMHELEPVILDICIKVAVFGLSIHAVRRKHGIRWQSAIDRLCIGLDLWNELGRGLHTQDAVDYGN